MLKEEKISCFNEILLAVLKFPEPEKRLIQEVQTICKLLTVNPASAAGERSLSSARRLKTSLRSKMRDETFSNLAVLPEWSQAENRQCLYSYTGVCFPQYESQEKLRHLRGLFNILPILDSINGETPLDFLALPP